MIIGYCLFKAIINETQGNNITLTTFNLQFYAFKLIAIRIPDRWMYWHSKLFNTNVMLFALYMYIMQSCYKINATV